jgi:hypothetical protein
LALAVLATLSTTNSTTGAASAPQSSSPMGYQGVEEAG